MMLATASGRIELEWSAGSATSGVLDVTLGASGELLAPGWAAGSGVLLGKLSVVGAAGADCGTIAVAELSNRGAGSCQYSHDMSVL